MKDKQREEWIEEKARELIDKIDDVYPALRSITYWENFIINLLNEMKLKVSQKFMEKWNKKFDGGHGYPTFWEALEAMLKEAGVEVEP